MQNNNHSNTKKSKLEESLLLEGPHMMNPTPSGKLVHVKLHTAGNGIGTFHKMRIMSEKMVKARMTMSKEDLLITRLMRFLHTFEGSGYDMSLPGHALRSMVCRISASTALRDSIECLIATYESLRRGLSAKDMMDSKSYHKALRSLQRAVENPKHQTSAETLAATTLVHRIQARNVDKEDPYTTDYFPACV